MKNTLLYNIPIALFGVLTALVFYKPVQPNYIVNMFYFVDILMNALTGGNGTITVSARTGFYDRHKPARHAYSRWFWDKAARIINFTFYPMDGPGHCEQAYVWARDNVLQGKDDEIGFMHGPKWSLVILMLVIILACIVLIPVLRIGKLFKLY